MSVISDRHSIVPFVAGTSKAFLDQRLAKVGYKSTAKNPAKFPSICASVPTITELDETELDRLLPHVVTLLQNAQDGIIRSLYESSNGSLKEVSDEDISINACINYLEAESQGDRLTKEYLEGWFNANVMDNLSVVIATKLGMEDMNENQMKVINQHLNSYRGLISSLAGGKTMLQPKQIAGIERALEISSVDDEVSKKLVARIQKMKEPVKIAEMLEL